MDFAFASIPLDDESLHHRDKVFINAYNKPTVTCNLYVVSQGAVTCGKVLVVIHDETSSTVSVVPFSFDDQSIEFLAEIIEDVFQSYDTTYRYQEVNFHDLYGDDLRRIQKELEAKSFKYVSGGIWERDIPTDWLVLRRDQQVPAQTITWAVVHDTISFIRQVWRQVFN